MVRSLVIGICGLGLVVERTDKCLLDAFYPYEHRHRDARLEYPGDAKEVNKSFLKIVYIINAAVLHATRKDAVIYFGNHNRRKQSGCLDLRFRGRPRTADTHT